MQVCSPKTENMFTDKKLATSFNSLIALVVYYTLSYKTICPHHYHTTVIFPLLAGPLPKGRGYARGGGWVVKFKILQAIIKIIRCI